MSSSDLALVQGPPSCLQLTPGVVKAVQKRMREDAFSNELILHPSVLQPSALTTAEEPQHKWVIQNVMARFECGTTLQPKEIALKFCNTEWTSRNPGRVYIRLRKPARATCLIFHTGKVIIMGSKSVQGTKAVAKKCAQMLHWLNPEVRFRNYLVTNLVAIASLPFPVDLEKLHTSLLESRSRYDPDVFSALIYHLDDPKVVCHIFVNGRINIAGAKTPTDLDRATDHIVALTEECRMMTPAAYLAQLGAQSDQSAQAKTHVQLDEEMEFPTEGGGKEGPIAIEDWEVWLAKEFPEGDWGDPDVLAQDDNVEVQT